MAYDSKRKYLKDYPLSGGQPRVWDVETDNFGATDWSRDERYLVFGRSGRDSDAADLFYYDLVDKRDRPFLATPAYESFGSLSPDGHWIAYGSNKGGAFEVYVQRFPEGGEEQKVSFAGGLHPRWNGDGTELYFLAPGGTMMAAKVALRPALALDPPVKLFSMVMADIIQGAVAPYDVSPDGKKFLVIVPVQSAPVPLTLLQNWAALAKR
jgi:hypothetical protein